MTAKEYLSQLHKLDMEIDQNISEIHDLEQKAISIGSFDYTKDRVQTSSDAEAQYAKLIDKMVDMQSEVNTEIDTLVDQKKVVIGQIRGLNNRVYMDVLYKRYVEYKDFETIREEMNYSYSTVTHAHGEALQAFENLYDL